MKRKTSIFRLSGDRTIWVICFILSVISLIAVYSSIGYTAIVDMHTSPVLAFVRHLLFVLGLYVAALVTSNISYQVFSRGATVLYLVALVLLLTTALVGGRWIRIPIIGTFQPSEIAKIFVVIFTARTLALQKDKMSDVPFFWLTLIPLLVVVALILPQNLSTALLVLITGLVMMYVGEVRKRYIGILLATILLGGALGLFVSYKVFHSSMAESARNTVLARAETWSNRVDHWINPNDEESSQENMAHMAVADGGFFKVNIGGTVHARLMTQANNDFIYAIIVEETGSLMGIIIFILYTIFYYRCIMLAYWSGRRYGGLLVLGLSTSIYLQAIVHMLVCVGVIPVTGQTLPLISTGGTSLLFTGFAIGLIQSVARTTKEAKKKEASSSETTPPSDTDNSDITPNGGVATNISTTTTPAHPVV